MSCVPCGECGEGANITTEDLDRWTDSLSNVLASQEGRARFKQYLERANMEEGLNTLDFWEQCTRLTPKKADGQDSPPHSSCSSSSSDLQSLQAHRSVSLNDAVTESMRADLRRIFNFASQNVNFDHNELREMRKVLRAHTGSEVAEILMKTKTRAAELLRDEYDLFRRSLLKERGLYRKC